MADMNTPLGVGVGLEVIPLDKLIQQQLDADNSLLDKEGSGVKKLDYDSLTSYVLSQFQINKDAKTASGIEDEIFDSVRAINGKYSQSDLSKISSEGGSNIFMNLTATKARTAKSWLADIFVPSKGKAWGLEPSPVAAIPDEIRATIEQAINAEFNAIVAAAPQEGVSAEQSQQTITDTNQNKRDIITSIAEEVNKESKFQLINMEKMIEDQLNLGNFNPTLLTFLEDLCTYPSAFIKGPVICKKPKIYWDKGKPVATDQYYFMNERVDPLDVYPSPDATTVQEGNFIEHLRMSPHTLGSLKGIKGYSTDNINEVLSNELYGNSWLDSGIESDKAEEELRGDEVEANKNVVHGLHYFGTVPYRIILEWNPSFKLKEKLEPHDLVEVEIILAGTKVIKCNVNGDPLKRRPYYKASYMNRPGSFWGRSLPSMMSDIQRMCNAAARSIANNMSIASGPQVEIYVNRLADDGPITEIKPMKIWQTQPDPTGAGGRAIDFFQPQMIAGELLGIYDRFEQKADAVTGIPAYAYGNDQIGTAATTVQGLSMLLETTSKIIKDCVRNVDEGVIKPRIEYQFYWNLIYNQIEFSGDVEVVPRATSILTTRASEALRRMEFLQITANQFDQQAMGDGRTEILRAVAEDIGLSGGALPSRLEAKRKQKQIEANAQAQAQIEQQEKQADREASVAATQIQIGGQEKMHQGTLMMQKEKLDRTSAIEEAKVQLMAEDSGTKHQLKGAEIQANTQSASAATKAREDANLRGDRPQTFWKDGYLRDANKKDIQAIIQRDKHGYREIKKLMELDLEELKNLLCMNSNPDTIHVLQGKAQQLIEYIRILT